MKRAFSITELLVVIAVTSVVLSIMASSLGGARRAAHAAVCLSNQRQLVSGWSMYATDYQDRAMPLAYTDPATIGLGDRVYWWGSDGAATGQIDPASGFLAPYIGDAVGKSVYECPRQPWGTYKPQGPTGEATSTYGYNGYFLSPPYTPGWSASIGHRPWQRVASIMQPASLFVFADTLLPGAPSNNALLDPPMLFVSGQWTMNFSPTTAFRHGEKAAIAARADGSVSTARAGAIIDTKNLIGSVGESNGPHYVPDWEEWK